MSALVLSMISWLVSASSLSFQTVRNYVKILSRSLLRFFQIFRGLWRFIPPLGHRVSSSLKIYILRYHSEFFRHVMSSSIESYLDTSLHSYMFLIDSVANFVSVIRFDTNRGWPIQADTFKWLKLNHNQRAEITVGKPRCEPITRNGERRISYDPPRFERRCRCHRWRPATVGLIEPNPSVDNPISPSGCLFQYIE